MQRVHFQVWVGVSSYQQILTEISFVIFDIVVKKQIECRLAWHWWNSTDLGHVFLAMRMQKLLLVYYYSAKSRCKPNLESTSKYDFFPRFGGKKWRRSEHTHASYSGLFFSPARVQPLYGAGRKDSSGTALAGGSIKYLNNAHVFSFCPCPTLFECLVPTLLSWSYEHWLTLNVVVWFYFLHWKNPCRWSQGALVLHDIGNTRITWIRLRSSLSINQVPTCSVLSAAYVFRGICNSS